VASRHLDVHIDRAPADVYDYVRDPRNLPSWAAGLGSTVEQVDGRWYVETPGGRAAVAFAPRNDLGVLDHVVTTPSGAVVHVPMRVVRDGDGAEVVFTVRREPGMTDAEFERDAGLVAADLARLKHLLESGVRPGT
jgi:Polyketide cyclase / dehydrase and lipid transport